MSAKLYELEDSRPSVAGGLAYPAPEYGAGLDVPIVKLFVPVLLKLIDPVVALKFESKV